MRCVQTILVAVLLVCAESAAQADAISGFWTALAAGDTASLRAYYDDNVTIRGESELLKNKWGICTDSHTVNVAVTDTWQDTAAGGAITTRDTTFLQSYVVRSCQADTTVPVSALLTALDSLVRTTNGEWSTWLSAIPPGSLTQQTLSATEVQLSVATGNGDDTLQYVFTTTDAGVTWKITAELTDY
ncbi:MAG: hypothetical protein GF331_03860 [Chitinivibrionales bacterium]|nr:hypothetical protein [Chitinivibrionales bacterium]